MGLILYASLGVAALGLYKLAVALSKPLRSPLLTLPGPKSPSWLWGQSKQIFAAENSVLHQEWIEKYGKVITYTGFLGINRLYTHDMRALNHILTHSADFQKPEETRTFLTRLLGAGVLVTEGEQHRQQRRVMNPAFGPAQIRGLTPIFNDISLKLRDMWAADIAQTGTDTKVIDALTWLSRATLDIIGQAGFNYHFNNLEGGQSELNDAFNTVFTPDQDFNLYRILRQSLPLLRSIPNKRMKQMDNAQKVMRRIGLQLIADKKTAILAEKAQQTGAGGVEKRDMEGRDLLTLLLKANMATDIPESQRLSDEDVLAQVPTFLLAGHETTSTGTTWALYALTQAPEVQRKLREELLSVSTDTPSMDELMALPYLDMVVKEVLRLHTPVPSTVRIATKEEIIPISEPFTDRNGEVQDKITIGKDDLIFIPILAMNRDKAIWGEDSFEFRPERWETEPATASGMPGVWGHLMTFIGGPRACIGYRFSIVEMKALLFALIRAFEFELAVPAEDLIKKTGIVQRPLVRTEMAKGTQMPLIVKTYHRQ